MFDSANRLQERSPVRIAGVNVGKVTKVEPLEDGSGKARVTMEIDDSGLPIKEDAELKVRSRLFLEGNYFVDLHPGRPDSPELDSGATIGPNQTAAPVQYLQVLTALQSETRSDLQRLLKEYSSALRGRGARGFNQAIKHWEEALAHDLAGERRLPRPRSRTTSRACSTARRACTARCPRTRRRSKDLVTGLNDTMSGFARQEDNLRAAIPELRDVLREGRPALASLNTRAARDPRLRARRAAGRALLEGHARRAAAVHRPGAQADVRARSSAASRARLRAAVPYLVRAEPGHAPHARAEPGARLVPEQRPAAVREDADPGPGLRLAHRRAVVRGVAAGVRRAVGREPHRATRTRRCSACSPAAGRPRSSRRRRRWTGRSTARRSCRSTACGRCARRKRPAVPPRRAVRDAGGPGPERARRAGRRVGAGAAPTGR